MLPSTATNVWTGKLNNCVLVNHAAGVRAALEHGARPDGLSKGLRTPLHTAAMRGNLEVVRLLCDYQANTNLRSLLDKGMQPLHLAAKQGHAEVVEELISRGANCQERYSKGLQAVHLAAAGDHVEVLQVLQRHRCDLEAPARDGYTPLHLAAENNCVKVARWLMDQRVTLSVKNQDLLTPEDCARRRKNLDLAEMLQQYTEKAKGSFEDNLPDTKGDIPRADLRPATKPDTDVRPPIVPRKIIIKDTVPMSGPKRNVDLVEAKPTTPQPVRQGAAADTQREGQRAVRPPPPPPRELKPQESKQGRDLPLPAPNEAKPRMISEAKPVEPNENKPKSQRGEVFPVPNETKQQVYQAVPRPTEEKPKHTRNSPPAPPPPPPRETKPKPGQTERRTETRMEPAKRQTTEAPSPPSSPRETKPSLERRAAGGQPMETKPTLGHGPPVPEAPRETKPHQKLSTEPRELDKRPPPRETKPANEEPNKMYKQTEAEGKTEAKHNISPGGGNSGGGIQQQEEQQEQEDDVGVLYRLLTHGDSSCSGGDSSGDSGIDQSASDPAEEELVVSVSEGNYETVCRLLDQGVSTEVRSKRDGERGLRPLHLAAWSGHDNIVRLLLEYQVNRKAMAHGLAAVHWAAVGGHVSVLALLWDEGFSIKARAEDGTTALHLAADHGNLEAVTWLVDKGAYLQVKDKRGNTPKNLALQAGNKAIVKFLQEKEDEIRLENMIEKKKLGEGTFGDVYLVKTGNKQVVVKKIDLSQLTRKQQEYAHTEFRTLKTLDHPYVVAYKGGGFQGRYLNIHMEYCSGGDLAARIEEHKTRGVPFEEKQVQSWVMRLCLALKYIHGRKILHRDIKPHNIFLTDAGTIKLGDFGLVRVLGEDSIMAVTALGTPAYMSPEIFEGVPYNTKADMWSLGCCLYEFAALERGFHYAEVKVPGNFSPEYKSLVTSLLQRHPSRRPDAREVLMLPMLVDVMGSQLESREQEVAGLNHEVQELSEEVTEMAHELERLRARQSSLQETKPK